MNHQTKRCEDCGERIYPETWVTVGDFTYCQRCGAGWQEADRIEMQKRQQQDAEAEIQAALDFGKTAEQHLRG